MAQIKISLNGNSHLIPEDINITELFSFLELNDKFVAVELNDEIVFRSNWKKVKLSSDDKVELVKAIGGG
ncbi:MAG: sulfur carrier protein ThiS [Gammaproteobacteria bacterium]|tara:strand:+ start:309 stop:518 length:210 start_codon:yes stop_codon:yes gene_type:complete